MNNIETKRLFLRPLEAEDLDELFLLYSNYELMKYITGQVRDYEKTKQRLKAHIEDHKKYGFGLCATILKSTGKMIGRCGIEPVEDHVGLHGDVAWMFKKEHWGKGLATEFGQEMIRYGFKNYPITRIFATADPENKASINVMRKIGMAFVKASEEEVEYEIWHPGRKPKRKVSSLNPPKY